MSLLTSGLTQLPELRRQILLDLDDFEGVNDQLSCNIPRPVNMALKEYAESFKHPKITKSQIVAWALIRFCREHNLLTSS